MTIRRYLVAPPQGSGGGEGGAVDSVNGQTGAVTLDAADVGAQPADSDLTAIAALAPGDGTLLGRVAGAWAAVDTSEITPADIGAQPSDTDLTVIAGLTHANDTILQTKSGAWAARTPAQVKTDLALAKADVGLGNVDNTTDLGKPVSTATQTALNGKALALPNPAAGAYFFTASAGTAASTTVALGNETLRLSPWVVHKTLTIDRIGAEITTAGQAASKFRLGVYADNGNCIPGSRLLDAGQINADSATSQELAASLTLQPGLYWIGGVVQAADTTQPAMRVLANWTPPVPIVTGTIVPSGATGATCYTQTGVSGALPTNFTTTVAIAGTVPRIFVRAA